MIRYLLTTLKMIEIEAFKTEFKTGLKQLKNLLKIIL